MSHAIHLLPVNSDTVRIEAARIASIFERLKGTAITNVVNAGLITLATAGHGSLAGMLIWLAAICALAAARGMLPRLYLADPLRVERNHHWATASIASSLLAGMAWGLGPILLLSDQPADYWLWSLAIGGMCAGAASLHAAHPPTALAFILPAGLLLMVSAFRNGAGTDGLATAALILAFMLVTTNSARRFSDQFGATMSLGFALERQAAELNRSNQQLSAEIEQHRKTAADLLQAQKMDALGKVTGGIAHDFNNLLTVILIGLQSILKNSEDARISTSASLALEAANGGADLAAELLAFSRKEPAKPIVANLNRLIEQFRPLLAQAVERRAVLDVDLAGKAMAVVDVARFQSALINLVVNARDAMDGPGRIMISTSLTLLDDSEAGLMDHGPGTFIKIDVVDTGRGMPPEVAAKAFDPFFTTKGAGEGTGLGLSQVYGFARQAGGGARIKSIPGTGTCVTLLIPATDVEPPAPEQPVEPRIMSGAGRHVLLVDDNTALLLMMRGALVEEGWEVRFADEGRTALHILEHDENLDLLVTDISMPKGLNGLDLARTARERWPHLGVLLISGVAAADGAALLPEVEFLAKPFKPGQFVEAINASLARRATPRPRLGHAPTLSAGATGLPDTLGGPGGTSRAGGWEDTTPTPRSPERH